MERQCGAETCPKTGGEWGHLETAKWLAGTFPVIDVHADSDHAFRGACAGGHLETVKWLWKTFPAINVHALGNHAFRWACGGGHLETAKWLVEAFGPAINTHAIDDQPFRVSCEGVPLEKSTGFPFEFTVACAHGHLETARWVANLNPEWEPWDLEPIKTWSKARDAWIRAVVHTPKGFGIF
jgi:hypothetical protein